MDYQHLIKLIDKAEDRTASPAELLELDEFYDSLADRLGYLHTIEDPHAYTEMILSRIKAGIASGSSTSYNRTKRLWPRLVAAAMITVAFGAGLFYLNRNKQSPQDEIAYQHDIGPGKTGATLTLADGKKINLADAANQELARETGVIISKTSDGTLVYQISGRGRAPSEKINTLTTANGETYRVKLPDGTSVWLNAESSISYPASFTGLKQRVVQLTGEAYLEVAKDKHHPFVVRATGQEVRVLGTHFNVSAYPHEPAKTTLIEGSVKVSTSQSAGILNPGQQAVVEKNTVNVRNADLDEAIAWKDGNFNFDGESISSIMTILARWYDIEVDYQGDFTKKTFTGSISRFRNISQVLKIMEQTKSVHFKIEGRRVTVMK